MNNPAAASSLPKYARVAANVRAQIAAGILVPGASAPSGAELARATGYSTLTCRKALRGLIKDGVLVPGASPNARFRNGLRFIISAGQHRNIIRSNNHRVLNIRSRLEHSRIQFKRSANTKRRVYMTTSHCRLPSG